jgi:hypothetical protein
MEGDSDDTRFDDGKREDLVTDGANGCSQFRSSPIGCAYSR